MAAPKKKPAAKKASAKKAPAKQADTIQDAVSTLQGFQLYTLIGLGLLVAFVVFQLFVDLRFIWWLNVPAAVGAAGLLWHQGKLTKGLELKVCTYALYAIIAMFVLRDAYLADTLNSFNNWADFYSLKQ